MVVDGFETVVELRPAESDAATAADADGGAELPRAWVHLHALRRHGGIDQPLRLDVLRALPAHAGLGSGTQLALALGHAFARLRGLHWTSEEIARITGRGLRSGIGIAGFDRGGLLLDGGPGPDGAPAPVLVRLSVPAEWRVLLVLDRRRRGLSGEAERAALARLAPLPREAAAEISHELLMRVLPAVAGARFEDFAQGLGRIQSLLGAHFAPAQEAGPFTSPAVERAMDYLARHRGAPVGQSSWGPTGFAFFPDAQAAAEALRAVRDAGAAQAELTLHVVAARDHGARITRVGADA